MIQKKNKERLKQNGTLNHNHFSVYVEPTQDNPITKPRSIVADFDMLIPTIENALEGEQISPMLI